MDLRLGGTECGLNTLIAETGRLSGFSGSKMSVMVFVAGLLPVLVAGLRSLAGANSRGRSPTCCDGGRYTMGLQQREVVHVPGQIKMA